MNQDSSARSESFYRRLSLAALVVFLFVAWWTVDDFGMGWDEATRWHSGDLKIDYYRKLFSSESPLAVVEGVGSDRYPGLFDMTLSLAHRLTGWERFRLGHLWSVTFGLFALIGVWLGAWRLGGARLGFWAALFLLLIPSFYGHLFHNPKDIPFAAMYMAGVGALVFFARQMDKAAWKCVVPIGFCFGLAMSVRIAGLVLFAYYTALVGLWLIRQWALGEYGSASNFFRQERSRLFRFVGIGGCAGFIALCTLMLWWPAGQKNIFSATGTTFEQLHTSASAIPLFFRAQWMPASDAPFYYAIWMFFIKSPESLLLLLLVAILGVLARVRRNGLRSLVSELSLPWYAIVLGAVFPLAYLTCTAPALHNGVRHFLFVFPPFCIIAAHAWLCLLKFLKEKGFRYSLLVARILVPGLLLIQVLQLVALHPYQYVYYNALIGGPAGSYGRYETEYWFTSTKHGLEALEHYINNQEISSKSSAGDWVDVYVLGPREVAEAFLPAGFRLVGAPDEAEYVIANTQMMIHAQIGGGVVMTIERSGLPILYIYHNERKSVPFEIEHG